MTDFLFLVGLAHLVTAVGFLRWDYFMSYGYAGSILVGAVASLTVLPAEGGGWVAVAHLVGLAAWALRLMVFVRRREASSPTFASVLDPVHEVEQRMSLMPRIGIWIFDSWFYPLMLVPTIFVRSEAPSRVAAALGLSAMALGLLLETIADEQKDVFKRAHGDTFCQTGLFRFCRHPNYAGELLFWVGVFVTGIGTYQTASDWAAAAGGLVGIGSVMVFMTRDVEKRQLERYGAQREFLHYATTVPLLVPGIGPRTMNPRMMAERHAQLREAKA